MIEYRPCRKCQRQKPENEWCPVCSTPRFYRDEKNRGTWIDGEFVSDKDCAKKEAIFVTTTEGPNEFWPFKNRVIESLPRNQGKTAAMKQAIIDAKAEGKIVFISTPAESPKPNWGLPDTEEPYPNRPPTFLTNKQKADIVFERWDSFPSRNSWIGWAFYWVGQQCSRRLRRWVMPTGSTMQRDLHLCSPQPYQKH